MNSSLKNQHTKPQQSIDVAIFGGSFDPPHCAHVMVVSYLLTCTDCDKVAVMPVFEHPFHKQTTVPFEAKVEMCKMAFQPFGDLVEVLDIEQHLPTPSYTVQTLTYLKQQHPHWNLHLVVGSDIIAQIHLWKDFERIQSLANLIVLSRTVEHPTAVGPVFPDVSSSQIRESLAKGSAATFHLLPKSVLQFILKEGFYRD